MENISILISFLSASLLVPVLVVSHVMLVRFKPQGKPLQLLLIAFLIYVLFFIALFITQLSRGQNFYGSSLITGLSIQIFFFLGYLEFFSMVCRGFSLRILVDVYSKKAMSLENIQEGYGEKGVEWMLSKRLESLLSLGLVDLKDDTLSLKKPLAWFLGRVGLFFKKFFNMGKGG